MCLPSVYPCPFLPVQSIRSFYQFVLDLFLEAGRMRLLNHCSNCFLFCRMASPSSVVPTQTGRIVAVVTTVCQRLENQNGHLALMVPQPITCHLRACLLDFAMSSPVITP